MPNGSASPPKGPPVPPLSQGVAASRTHAPGAAPRYARYAAFARRLLLALLGILWLDKYPGLWYHITTTQWQKGQQLINATCTAATWLQRRPMILANGGTILKEQTFTLPPQKAAQLARSHRA